MKLAWSYGIPVGFIRAETKYPLQTDEKFGPLDKWWNKMVRVRGPFKFHQPGNADRSLKLEVLFRKATVLNIFC